MSFYLVDDMKPYNVAVNVLIPGHTRTTGFDEQNLARMKNGATQTGPKPLVPEHMVPIALHLAAQPGGLTTGKMFHVETWNMEHGLGGKERWLDTSFSYEALRASLA